MPSLVFATLLYAGFSAHSVEADVPNLPTSCVSAPDSVCGTLMGRCASAVASGQTMAIDLWSNNACVAAAMCNGVDAVLDTLCCAGTCYRQQEILGLGYTDVYHRMSGDCAGELEGCLVNKGNFTGWFHGNLQRDVTDTVIWSTLEDDSARSWTAVASWTGPCTEADCTNKSVTYGDVDDWLHTSAAAEVSANNKTFDGTASVDISADPEDCSWDLMPTTLEDEDDIADSVSPIDSDISTQAVLGGLLVGADTLPPGIVPAKCTGSVDTPTTLPTLSYYCDIMPNICANIRSHPSWPTRGDSMTLTYDPYGASTGKRRGQVCTVSVKSNFQNTGKCDKRQHDPAYWKVSCDEFPFNSSLEGGAGNAQVRAVPSREQQYQGTLQSSITNLFRIQGDSSSIWKKATMCHAYRLRLLDRPETGAGATAVGSLDSGSAWFSGKPGTRGRKFITDKRKEPIPSPYPVDTAYPRTASALKVPCNSRTFDCR